MSNRNTITSHISEEAQEALEFLEEKNIDVNSTINRIIMRAAQEEGWQISLMPKQDPAQGKKATKESKAEVEPTSQKSRSGDENSNLIVPAAPAQKVPPEAEGKPADPTPVQVPPEAAGKPAEPTPVQVPPEATGKPAEPTPVPVEKPFEAGVVLAASKAYDEDLPTPSSLVKKAVVEPVAGASPLPDEVDSTQIPKSATGIQ